MHRVVVQCSAVQCCVAQCMDTHRVGYVHGHGRGCVLRRDPAGAVVRSLHNVVDVVDMLVDIVDMFGFVLRHECIVNQEAETSVLYT